MPYKNILGNLEWFCFLSPRWWATFKISFKVIFIGKNSPIIFEKLNESLFLIYLQFTKYDLSFISLKVTTNKLGEGVLRFHKEFFLSPKNNTKQRGLSKKLSLTTNAKYEHAPILYLKINVSFFCCPLFFKDFLSTQDH